MKKFEFHYAFQITRKIIFEVEYYTLGSNKSADFTTCANEFNQPKTDWCRCGQAQKDLLVGGLARSFYDKWDKYHLKDITDQEVFDDLIKDIEELKKKYNYIGHIADSHPRDISFWELKKLSMNKKYIGGTVCQQEA